MTCSKCNTHFCYYCGRKHTSVPGLGGHYDGISVLGCPKHYRGLDKSHAQEAVRYGYIASKLSAGLAYPALYIAGIGIVAVGAAVVLPVYGGVKLYKRVKKNKRERRRREAAAQKPQVVPSPPLHHSDSLDSIVDPDLPPSPQSHNAEYHH